MPRRAPAKKAQPRAEESPSPPPPEPSTNAPAFLLPQANRDPQSNWEVDLTRNLEEYLLRICSGDLSAEDQVSFSEAALVVEGSVRVYSRKVDYLYTLVLHFLDSIAHKASALASEGQDNQEDPATQPDVPARRSVVDEDEGDFLGLDDVPEDAKNSLESGSNMLDVFNNYVKPPANLVVLEGECLDTTGEAGELESYLLSTCNFYGDFLLLDPCDADAVMDFMQTRNEDLDQNASHRVSSRKSKVRNPFTSPVGRSGGSRQRLSIGKRQNDGIKDVPAVNLDFDTGYQDDCCQPNFEHHTPDIEVGPDVGSFDDGECSDDDDPWKPLNPHEPACLKVKPYKKVATLGRKSLHRSKPAIVVSEFPLAKLDGIISSEFTMALELYQKAQDKAKAPQSPPLLEKLRRSLRVENETFDIDADIDDGFNSVADADVPDFEPGGFEGPESTLNMDNEVPFQYEKGLITPQIDAPCHPTSDPLDLGTSLEDLCHAHLDLVLASIAENEKQTELAARVSSWKQRIEHSLEEEDSHTPFDIHLYGEKVLSRLSSSADHHSCMPFGDVVQGLEKREIARTFSAMLQLVNNGNIELIRKQSKHESICYTSSNPFAVKLIDRSRREIQVPSMKKRLRSPLGKACCLTKSTSTPFRSPENGKLPFRLTKRSTRTSSPDSKRRRRSQAVQQVAIQLDR